MKTTTSAEQSRDWAQDGRHNLARHDDTTARVYEACRPEIADFAVEQPRFVGVSGDQRGLAH